MNLKLIASVGKNNELGRNNALIWELKEDLDYFKKITQGSYIVMGRKTFESLPKRLEGRKYIVFSNTLQSTDKNMLIMDGIENFLRFAEKATLPIFIIGGAKVYSLLLPYCDTLYLTEVESNFSAADAFFPAFDKNEWEITKGEKLAEGEITYSHNIYKRKK